MRRKNSKKFLRHMLFYQMTKKENDMIPMVMLVPKKSLEVQKQTSMKYSRILALEASGIFLSRYLEEGVLDSVVQVVTRLVLDLTLVAQEGGEGKTSFMTLNFH